jgi:glucose/arabinose dehydrogenase
MLLALALFAVLAWLLHRTQPLGAEPARGPGVSKAPDSIARSVKLTPVASGLHQPLALTFAPGDPAHRIFVVQKTGQIRILRRQDDGTLAADAAPFLDLAGQLSQGSEQGLLGLAFHPQYASNGRFFVDYTDKRGNTRIVEYRVDSATPDRADPASRDELLEIDQPYSNHNGGDVVFGPDGRLYVGMGDGGSHADPHGNGQNAKARLAKLLQIDVDAPKAKPVLRALGLRNPWRFSFDRANGNLWIGDVGQDRFEEVDEVPGAAVTGTAAAPNFGWNVWEGMHCFTDPNCSAKGFVAPVVEYPHPTGCSITGGFVYRGKAVPALEGRYFYADYCTALLRSVTLTTAGTIADSWEWRPALDPGDQLSTISSFGEDESGELYVLSLDGTIWRFDPR